MPFLVATNSASYHNVSVNFLHCSILLQFFVDPSEEQLLLSNELTTVAVRSSSVLQFSDVDSVRDLFYRVTFSKIPHIY